MNLVILCSLPLILIGLCQVVGWVVDRPKPYKPLHSDYDLAKQRIDCLLREAEETVRRWEN